MGPSSRIFKRLGRAMLAPAGYDVGMDAAMRALLTESLNHSPSLAPLPLGVREAMLANSELRSLRGGDTLLDRGQKADALFLLQSGSLGVFSETKPGSLRLLTVLGPGETIGEASILIGQPQSHTVRALRDCTLLRIPAEDFERAITQDPAITLAVARSAAQRLLAASQTSSQGGPRCFALLPFNAAVDPHAVAHELARAMAAYGKVLTIDALQGQGKGPEWFDTRERENRFVLYVADTAQASWRATCLRQCDQPLLLAPATAPAEPWPDPACHSQQDALHRPRHLLLLGAPGQKPLRGRAGAWLRQFREQPVWHHVRGRADYERLARRLTGHDAGLVLSGGGARGFAHVGVVRALRALGRPIDQIGGTSIGGIVAAGVACEWADDELLAHMHDAFVAGHPLRDLTVPLIAATRGVRTTRLLRSAFGERDIEDLALPFFCVSSNLSSGCAEAHCGGPLWLWLRASAAIPGILPPLLHQGAVHVDGAVMNNLPIDIMHQHCGGPITAVDISGDDALGAAFDAIALPRLPTLTWRWLHGHRWPSLFSILVRAAMVHSETASAQHRNLATHLLSPPHEGIGLLDWHHFQRAAEAGYRHTMTYFEQKPEASDCRGHL